MMLESADQFEADIRAGKPVADLDSLWQRNVEEGRAAAEQLAERAAAARADAAATRERLAGVDRKIVDLDNEVRVAGDESQAARMAIFALDDQARYVDEAARRYGEAAAAGDNIPERAAKELAAEQAMRNANATAVDRRRNPASDPDVPGRDARSHREPMAACGARSSGPRRRSTRSPAIPTRRRPAMPLAPRPTRWPSATRSTGRQTTRRPSGTDVAGAAADGNDAEFLDSEAARAWRRTGRGHLGGFDEYSGAETAVVLTSMRPPKPRPATTSMRPWRRAAALARPRRTPSADTATAHPPRARAATRTTPRPPTRRADTATPPRRRRSPARWTPPPPTTTTPRPQTPPIPAATTNTRRRAADTGYDDGSVG